MSASILYEPNVATRRTIPVLAPSAFMETMARVGLALPCVVSREDRRMLEGMAAVFHGDHNPYQAIVDLLDEHESIRLRAEY